MIPGFGGTQRLTRLVGRARAKEMIFTGDMIDAAKAKEIGLALEVLPPAELMAHCKKIAATIAKRGPLGDRPGQARDRRRRGPAAQGRQHHRA